MVQQSARISDTSPFRRYADAGYQPFLIPIIPPTANMAANSQGVADKRGKVPGKRLPSGDWVGFGAWPKHVTEAADVAEWSSWPGAGLGVRCGRIVAVDVDVTDEALAVLCRDAFRQALGVAPIRVGSQPKHLHAYRLREGDTLKKLRMPFTDKNGVQHAVEILADGQQFVAEGIHPKTAAPYKWGFADAGVPDGLSAFPFDALPEVTADAVRQTLASLSARLTALGCTVGGGVNANAPASTTTPAASRNTVPGLYQAALEAIPNDGSGGTPDYDEWLRLTISYKVACGDTSGAYEAWETWSLGYADNSPELCRQKWESFHPPFTIGSGYLIDAARVRGFRTAQYDFSAIPGATATGGESPEIAVAVEELNRDHIYVWTGTEGVVRQRTAEPGEQPRITITTLPEIRVLYASRLIAVVNHQGNTTRKKIADVWRDSPNRRAVRGGFTFRPGGEEIIGSKANLWAGYAVEPSATGSCALFTAHVFEVLCGGNPVLFDWVADWLADLIQGGPKPGTAIAIRGPQGAGKSLMGEYLGVILGEYRVAVNSDAAVTGNFNSQLGRCQLLQADEAFVGGDKKAASKLKDIITSPTLRLEQKGRDAVTVENHMRILFTSNESAIVTAEIDDRRWLILDAGSRYVRNREYFNALVHEMNNGGPAALLYALQLRKITADLRVPPTTEGLADQKRLGLTGPASWLHDAAHRGGFATLGEEWPEAVPAEAFYEDYKRALPRGEAGTPPNRLVPELERAFAGFRVLVSKRAVPINDLSGQGASGGRTARRRCYVLPPLNEVRALIDRALGVPTNWE
jgi:hypothetical protein